VSLYEFSGAPLAEVAFDWSEPYADGTPSDEPLYQSVLLSNLSLVTDA
jgi:hypothetical protein